MARSRARDLPLFASHALARAQYKDEAQRLEQQLVEEKAKNQRQIEEDAAHIKKLWQE